MFLNSEFIENPPEPLKVDLPVFQGPLDLLLYLIKREEVDIYSIPLERITDGFLKHLALMQELNLDIAGEYVVMAATLLYIKSRSLLPREQQVMMEEAEDEDPRWELIRQLLEYKKFKDVSMKLNLLYEAQSKVAWRGDDDREMIPKKVKRLGPEALFALLESFQKIVSRFQEQARRIEGERFQVSDKILWIRERLSGGRRVLFSDLFDSISSRDEVVVTFLAVLELVRLKKVLVLQESLFAEIELREVPDHTENGLITEDSGEESLEEVSPHVSVKSLGVS
jgi:segregation and condensation protein A